MQSFTLPSTTKQFTRKAWYLPSIAKPQKIAIFLDAEIYLDRIDATAVIADLEREGIIPSTACLFLSNHNEEARQHDYTCSDPFADYLAKDVFPWMQKQSGIASGNHLIAGLSLSGLQAAYTALSYPRFFSSALSQSGSFWWENEWLTKHLREFNQTSGKYWLSVGTKEKGAGMVHPPTELVQGVDQDIAIQNFSAALKQHGGRIRDHQFQGGHDATHWKAELPDALAWLLA